MEHPNIVAFMSSYEEMGVVGILMEHAAGGDLQKEIDKRLAAAKEGGVPKVPFPEYSVREYARQLGTALSYIHRELMLLHRDLKPANVFLSSSGAVKLGDFGFCKLINVRRINLWPQKQADGSPPEPRPEPPPPRIKVKGYKPRPYDHAVGTPLYMSPEHISGSPFDRSADTWAFACTVFEVMGLESPWSQILDDWGGMDGGMEGLYRLVTTAQLDVGPLRANYTDSFCSLVGKLLAREPSVRLALDPFIQSLARLAPILPPPPPPPPPPAPLSGPQDEAQTANGEGDVTVADGGDGSNQLPTLVEEKEEEVADAEDEPVEAVPKAAAKPGVDDELVPIADAQVDDVQGEAAESALEAPSAREAPEAVDTSAVEAEVATRMAVLGLEVALAEDEAVTPAEVQ